MEHVDKNSDEEHNGEKIRLVDSVCSITIAPLIHETQSLQLCAIHALNNLLQLCVHGKHGTTKNINSNQQIILCHGRLFRHAIIEAGTKGEFDAIADEVTRKEAIIYRDACAKDTDISEMNERRHRSSFLQALTSRHRTPLFGNYSYEVLEAALLERNVKLEWFTGEMDLVMDDPIRVTSDSELYEVTIGFVVNAIEPLTIWNAFARPFTGSRHWYAITNLRRILDYEVKNKRDNSNGMQVFVKGQNSTYFVDNCNLWHVIDSKSRQEIDLNHDELKQFLYDILKNGGSVIRATMKKLSPFE